MQQSSSSSTRPALHLAGSSSSSVRGPLTVPLLEAIARSPEQANALVQEALNRWEAASLLASWVGSRWRDHRRPVKCLAARRRRKSSLLQDVTAAGAGGNNGKARASPTQSTNILEEHRCKSASLSSASSYSIHWLFSLLTSSSRTEQNAAIRLLCKGCAVDDVSLWNVLQVLKYLVHGCNTRHRKDDAPVLPLVALLQHILLLHRHPEQHQQKPLPSLLSLAFLRRSLQWITSMLWKACLDQKDASVAAFVGLLQQVLLVAPTPLLGGSDDYDSIDRRAHSRLLWSTNTINSTANSTHNNNNELPVVISQSSPLLSLIATYHVWKQRKPSLTPRQLEVLSLLHQLVDPHTVPTVKTHSPSITSSTSSAIPLSSRRLWDTFSQISSRVAATTTSTTAASTAPVGSNRTTTNSTTTNGMLGSPSSLVSLLPIHLMESSSSSTTLYSNASGPPAGGAMNRMSSLLNRSSGLYGMRLASSPPSHRAPPLERDQELEEEDGSGEEDNDENDDHDDHDNDKHHNQDQNEEEDEEMADSRQDEDENDDDEDENDEYEMDDNNNYDQDPVETHEVDGNHERDAVAESAAASATVGQVVKKRRASLEQDIEGGADGGGGDDHGGGGNNDDNDDQDEEIDSDDDEDDDGEYDHEEEDEDEHDIVIHDEEEDEDNAFRQRLLDLQDHEEYQPPPPIAAPSSVTETRKKIYLKACHQVLATLHPAVGQPKLAQHTLSVAAEKDLLHSVLNIVHPPKKPANSKIIMRRAPTQEDFFRGSLSRNPISLQQIKKDEEPTVRDLRQHIANDLQMGDSAELLEILVANKILDVDLKLRVVHQVVWKQHLMLSQQGGVGASPGASALSQFLVSGRTRSLISSRGGLSMIFSGVGLGPPTDTSGNTITDDTPLSELPPMVVTYRLTGVDGEATEDTVTTLEDPEAPLQTSDAKQVERQLEKEFGMTRLLTEGRGVYCLLKSVERNINDTLRRIRRDDVGHGENLTRNHFKTCTPNPGLSLLSCSAKLASNRELLLQCRAPTILLRLLLDVLHALEGEGLSERNPTAKELQELIEILASDMLLSSMTVAEIREETAEDASTLRLLLGAIETSSLSRPLRNVIAKLLPYLTYGQPALSKELASEFQRHFDETLLRDGDRDGNDDELEDILMATFVHTSMALPANDVCNSLRIELIECGYVERIANFVLENFPPEPPGWSACLWAKGEAPITENLLHSWQEYTKRAGLKTAFDMLIGLCKGHGPTKSAVGNFVDEHGHFLIEACHWLESSSDNASARVSMKNLGLVAETLLDELSLEGSPTAPQVNALRTKTRDRKKDIAMERRSKALLGMGTFASKKASSDAKRPADQISGGPGGRGTIPSLLVPVLGLVGNTESASSATPSSKRRKTGKTKETAPPTKPSWMVEMEDMQDETGLTCAVCQEGKTLQPSELLGLYAYVKKVSVPISQFGGRNHIDGTSLLTALPNLPSSLSDSHAALEWYPAARATGEDLKESSRASLSSMASNRRTTYFTTTVSAGNAIHFGCHNRARQVDRNHPKAPKSEWEGATLRNSRVKCNVIMPLVTSRSSQVPLVAVDVALTEHQTAVSNLLGARPKSMLWNVLHDVRLLLLRMAYGEPLNTDCGGGSLQSNCLLVFHQLLMADMFEKDAQVDAPETAQHARHLSAGFLAACAITHAQDYNKRSQSLLHRGMADSSTMACLTCILFHNTRHDYNSGAAAAATSTSSDDEERPHPKRRWILGRDYFLRGLINCAGRRHALGIDGSGCSNTTTGSSATSNRTGGNRRRRTAGFADWDIVDEADLLELAGIDGEMGNTSAVASTTSRIRSSTSSTSSNSLRNATIDDFKDALRPMIVYFAIMDQLSNDFVLTLDDVKVDDFANNLVDVINGCNGCKTIRELLRKARVDMGDDEIIDELQKGMMAA